VIAPVYWIEAFAAQRGLHYEAEADERWLRAWEPYTTLKTFFRYEHALSATGGTGSITIARAVLELPPPPPAPARATEVGTWIAIVQDERLSAKVATTSDFSGIFAEPLDLVTLPRRMTGDPAFDHVFATFAETDEDLHAGMTASLRRLLLSWRVPVHAEMRPGGFVLAPVSVAGDDRGLAWIFSAVHLFGEKATKRGGGHGGATNRAT
jgi:hypothetical protein